MMTKQVLAKSGITGGGCSAKSKVTVLAFAIAAIVLAATPIAIASKNSSNLNTKDSHPDDDLVTVKGNVTAFLYDDIDDDEDDDDLDEIHEKNKTHEARICAFVLDNETIVTFGPWWYWTVQKVNVTDVVHLNDTVNVTGELENEDEMNVLSAWSIDNLTTGDKLTIREEGRPPWAGGPKALGIDPWPLSEEDD